jgi:hypothetical protein
VSAMHAAGRHYCGTGQFPHAPGPECSEFASPAPPHPSAVKLYRVRWENMAGDQGEMAVNGDSPEDAAWRAALKLQGNIELLLFLSSDEITAAERGEAR